MLGIEIVTTCEFAFTLKLQNTVDDSTMLQVMSWCRRVTGHYMNSYYLEVQTT